MQFRSIRGQSKLVFVLDSSHSNLANALDLSMFAFQLCRLERVSAGPSYRQDLFVECPPIFVSENCSPPSDSLMSLISLCGGKVMNVQSDIHLQ